MLISESLIKIAALFSLKYFTRKVIKTFMNNMGMNQEAFKNQTQQNSFNNQNGEVLYQKGETVVLKGEAGKEKK